MKNIKSLFAFFGLSSLGVLTSFAAHAQGIEDVARNIVTSGSNIPGLISGMMYLAGLLLVVTGLLKLKEHVDNERQTPIRTPAVRLIAGGMCFGLPLALDSVLGTILGGQVNAFTASAPLMTSLNGYLATLTGFAAFGTNFTGLLNNITIFSSDIPGLVTALAYLIGVLSVSSGILKLKEHVEEPEKVQLREPVTRFLTAGVLFALPYLFTVLFTTVAGTGLGFFGGINAVLNASNFIASSYSVAGLGTQCTTAAFGLGMSLGEVICMAMLSSIGLPPFLTALSYAIGLAFGLWGVFKVRDHVLNPTQTRLNEGVTRLLAAGAFFAMPSIAMALQNSFMPPLLGAAAAGVNNTHTGYAGNIGPLTCAGLGATSLDQAFGCFVLDILRPSQTVLNFFCFVAGLIFVMIGISRLIRSAQDGPRGPGGLGTVATFVAAGVLMSGTSMMGALTSSLFGGTLFNPAASETRANILFAAGMTVAEQTAALNVVTAVIRFMIIVGLISFVRGIFILRDSAEGKGQASVMSGVTHIIGGALAVNLGSIINAIQWTLGITAFGVTFT